MPTPRKPAGDKTPAPKEPQEFHTIEAQVNPAAGIVRLRAASRPEVVLVLGAEDIDRFQKQLNPDNSWEML